jgi:hypothetical protein
MTLILKPIMNAFIFGDRYNWRQMIGMWKENMQRKLAKRVKPTLAMQIEKYQR